nr:Hypothetical protein 4 CDS [Astacus astacus]
MSRTVFYNACASLKIECSHALDFKRDAVAITVTDIIGSFEVPSFNFLASYEFKGNTFKGTGQTKKFAIEHLFSRLISSKFMPEVPEKVDPTDGLDDSLFTLTITKATKRVTLTATDPTGKIAHITPNEGVDFPRCRYEALMSLVRHLLREHAVKNLKVFD